MPLLFCFYLPERDFDFGVEKVKVLNVFGSQHCGEYLHKG
jgi:hypothetical protein